MHLPQSCEALDCRDRCRTGYRTHKSQHPVAFWGNHRFGTLGDRMNYFQPWGPLHTSIAGVWSLSIRRIAVAVWLTSNALAKALVEAKFRFFCVRASSWKKWFSRRRSAVSQSAERSGEKLVLGRYSSTRQTRQRPRSGRLADITDWHAWTAFRLLDCTRTHDGNDPLRDCRVRAGADWRVHPLRPCCCQITREAARPPADRWDDFDARVARSGLSHNAFISDCVFGRNRYRLGEIKHLLHILGLEQSQVDLLKRFETDLAGNPEIKALLAQLREG